MSFGLQFWGVRGSIACPSPQHVRFGGNTSCIEVWAGEQCIILDAGTGIRTLGHKLLKQGQQQAQILLTHTHWDHINGFPFFAPGFQKECRFQIMAGHLGDREGIREVLAGQMMQPTFPVPLEAMKAELCFEDFAAGDSFKLGGGVRVKSAPLNHPNNATGYRIEHGGKSLCYVTDTEHVIGKPDQKVLDLISGADLVIYDCTYTDSEFETKIGWGHSTWQEAARLCRAAQAKKLAIFHHDPDHEDDFLQELEQEARAAYADSVVAREGMRISLV